MIALTAPLPQIDGLIDQRVYMVERARGRSVLHLGCADEGLTATRAGTGLLLHQELARCAKRLIGVDISAESLQMLGEIVPGEYVTGDIEEMDGLDLPPVDLVIASEVIEHLGSPGRFLAGLQRYLDRTGASAIITTPSAYSWRALATLLLRRRDRVHPDHLVVFTPVTLVKSLERAGLTVSSFKVHVGSERPRSAVGRVAVLLDKLILRINPFLGVGLVVEVTPSGNGDQ